ncbi:MAG: acyl-CoA reductase [Bacteroidetes bacterium]|nr:acyl-CoA reductase [Bacteroidota bacterium]
MILQPQFLAACSALTEALNTIPDSVRMLAKQHNPWFESENITAAAEAWSDSLQAENLSEWLKDHVVAEHPKKIAIIMAGNIPLVGLHDVLSVIVSGHIALCKLSSDDTILMNYCIDAMNKVLENKILRIERVKEVDAVIATGSNNSAKIFETYFHKLPHLIRRNRTAVAVLSGHETKHELHSLGSDIFSYFGLGCRNISKVFVPAGYDFTSFFEAIFPYGNIVNHHKYANNYDYNKAIYLMGSEKFLDNNFLMIRRDEKSLHSPLSVVFYDFYNSEAEIEQTLTLLQEEIQCVASTMNLNFPRRVELGKTQGPKLWDYADGIDTLKFLKSLQFEASTVSQ